MGSGLYYSARKEMSDTNLNLLKQTECVIIELCSQNSLNLDG